MGDFLIIFICLMDFQTVLNSITLSLSPSSVEEIFSLTKTISITPPDLTWSQCGLISTIIVIIIIMTMILIATRTVSEDLDLTGRSFHNMKPFEGIYVILLFFY